MNKTLNTGSGEGEIYHSVNPEGQEPTLNFSNNISSVNGVGDPASGASALQPQMLLHDDY